MNLDMEGTTEVKSARESTKSLESTSETPATGHSALTFTEHGSSSAEVVGKPPVRHTPRHRTTPSCRLCRQSKIRCDRSEPCSHCAKVGAECVYPVPSVRGRPAGRRKVDRQLYDRIAKLEQLVHEIESGGSDNIPQGPTRLTTTTELSEPQKRAPAQPSVGRRTSIDRYLGSTVWLNLSEEISGMREVLDQPSEDEDDQTDSTPPNTSSVDSPQSGPPSSGMIFGSDNTHIRREVSHPSPTQIRFFYRSFMRNVDPVVKLLHGPSLRKYFLEGSEQLECSPGPSGWEALKCAIFYSVISSLAPDECIQNLGASRDVLLSQYQHETENALEKADLLVTEDLSVLQALVLYLFALRSNNNSRRMWTLTSLAVRIAHALGLHREKYGEKSVWQCDVLQQEMRRRLWWQILLLDRQGYFDRGTDPIIPADSFSTELPLHVDDADLIAGSHAAVQPRQTFTDMTMSLVINEIFDTERRLNHAPAAYIDRSSNDYNDVWAKRRAWVVECQQRMENTYLKYCDTSVPLQLYTRSISDIMISLLWMWAYRPLQRIPGRTTSPQVPFPGILYLSVDVMEKSVRPPLEPLFRSFSWLTSIWVQWHALAVMLAELCVQTEGPNVERAWAVAPAAYKQVSKYIADSSKGKLWRPIRKLMHKAQAIRMSGSQPNPVSDADLTEAASMSQPPTKQQPTNFTSLTSSQDGEVPNIGGISLTSYDSGIQSVQQTLPYNPNLDSFDFNTPGFTTSAPPLGTDQAMELDQMGWMDWELFVDDLQMNGDFMSGLQDSSVFPPLPDI